MLLQLVTSIGYLYYSFLCWWLLELLLLFVVLAKIEDLYFDVTIVLGSGLVTSIATADVDDFYW